MHVHKATRTIKINHLERVILGPFNHGQVPRVHITYKGVDPPRSTSVDRLRVDTDNEQYNLVYVFQNFGNKLVTVAVSAVVE